MKRLAEYNDGTRILACVTLQHGSDVRKILHLALVSIKLTVRQQSRITH